MRALKFLGLVALFTGLFLVASVCLLNTFLPPLLHRGTVEVPEVRGLALAEAQRVLRGVGLKVRTQEIASRDYPPGVVIIQKPLPGTKVKRGRRVILTVSKGARRVRVPQLKGQDAEHAKAELRKLGLFPKVVEVTSSEAEPGQVLDTRPLPGAVVREGDTVVLVVSLGVPIEVSPDTALDGDTASGSLEAPGGGDGGGEGGGPAAGF